MVKSPLNYTGGKFKILPQLLPLFPDNINCFVDLFGGGYNVGINVKAEHYIYNDIVYPVYQLLKHLSETKVNDNLKQIEYYIEKFNLSNENCKENYCKFRSFYNNSERPPMMFFTLICFCFSNIIRFNKKGEFNTPYGKRGFNPNQKKNFIEFSQALSKQNIDFYGLDYCDCLSKIELTNQDLVYFDPPYLNSVANYNSSWNEQEEKRLLDCLKELDNNNIKWALSNNLNYKNELRDNFIKNYNINYLSSNYNNCSYQKKNREQDKNKEILVTNY